MTKNPPNTRREAQRLTPEIIGQYHDLLMTNDLAGFDRLLEEYNVAEEIRAEHRREFMLYARADFAAEVARSKITLAFWSALSTSSSLILLRAS
jgi:hypothetical protein